MSLKLTSLSFRNKIMVHAMLTSGFALVLACAAFVTYDLISFRESIATQLSQKADMIASNSTAAISFGDADTAQEILGALKIDPNIVEARLYTANGDKFAELRKFNQAASTAQPFPGQPKEPSHTFEGGFIHAFYPVVLDGDPIGTVYVQRDLKDFSARIQRYIGISFLVLFLSLLASFLLSVRFQTLLSRPVLELVRAAKSVSEERDYSVRAVKHSEDELGTLTDGFNEMLQQIQARDLALRDARDKLEVRVAERTRDLMIAKEAAETSAFSLKESEQRIRAIVDTAADGILTINPNGEIASFNLSAEHIFGYKADEIIGHDVLELFSPEQVEPVKALIQREQPPRESLEFGRELEVEGKRKGGDFFPLALRTAEMRYHDERVLIWTCQDISARKLGEEKLAALNRQLVEMARQAGMAEVATGVLHNVGNVLNSVNVSATLVTEQLSHSHVGGLAKATKLIEDHEDDLAQFFTEDKRGRQLPSYLSNLATHLIQEQTEIEREISLLRDNIEHIKEIVSMQQSYAGMSGVQEVVAPASLVEDALRLNAAALNRHEISVIKDLPDLPTIEVDKHKVLQILVNLIRNAKYALTDSGREDKNLMLSVEVAGEEKILVKVRDNGVGLASDQRSKIFAHGYTTRKHGHGFGLHSSALAAKEMNGSLSVNSEGPGKGCTFVLELPVRPGR